MDLRLASLTASMRDQDSAWSANVRRAHEQHAVLMQLLTDFRLDDAYTLTKEPTDDPLMVAWRLRIHRQPSEHISIVIGAILDKLVSALNALAHGLAEQSVGRALTTDEEDVVEFPMCMTPPEFEQFFDGDQQSARLRGAMYDIDQRAAMRAVQPFAIAEPPADETEERRQQRYRDDYEWSSLTRLIRLDDIAKQRQLSVRLWWMDLLHYATTTGDGVAFLPGDLSMQDNTILCYFRGSAAHRVELRREFALVLTDDPAHHPEERPYQPQDCLAVLASFAHIVEQTIGRVLSRL